VHLLASTLFSCVQLGLYVIARYWLLADIRPARFFLNILVAEFHANVLLYWLIIGLYHTYDYYCRYRERERHAAELELRASQLETQLARAQLDALRMQLQPHFLFNTLNTISVLMDEDVSTANRMLLRLSDLLRLALKNPTDQENSLREEMDFLRKYLEIEQTRFQHRLRVQIDIDSDALDARVPNLILQPLVENAIRHGVSPRATESTIAIRARRFNGCIQLQVSDDGSGFEAKLQGGGNGIGLANTRARLEKLYGAAHSFELSSANDHGTQVTITIPFVAAQNEGVNGENQSVDR
jgi:sensor histidine kinase YesM